MAAVTSASRPRPSVGGQRWLVVRGVLASLGIGQGVAAVWALFDPRGFYGDFPVDGAAWVSALPPFNEHLVRDYGASFLALAVLALAAAWIADRRLVRVALAVWVVAALPHLAFHLAHASDPGGVSGTLSLTTLAANALVPLLLLALVPNEDPR